MVMRRQSTERVGAHGPHVLLDVCVSHHLVLLTLVGMLQRMRSTDYGRTEVPAKRGVGYPSCNENSLRIN